MTTQTSDYWKLFKPKNCCLRLKGQTKEAALDELIENLVKSKALPAEMAPGAQKALADREGLASTGVGQNVAIPHVPLEGLDQVVVSLSLHPEGLDWNALDGDPVRILFTVLRPQAANEQYDPERHLDMMRWISRLCRDGDFRRFALAVKNRTELVDLLKEMSGV